MLKVCQVTLPMLAIVYKTTCKPKTANLFAIINCFFLHVNKQLKKWILYSISLLESGAICYII